MMKGFDKFHESLNKYFNMHQIDAEGCQIRIFGSVTLNNGAIVRATNKYYGKPWFSNVAVVMNNDELFDYLSDSGICYAQVYIIN